MVLVSVSSTDYVIGYAILSIVTVSFMPAPGLIKYYYPDSKLPTFDIACLRVKNITGTPPGHIALGDGTATPADQPVRPNLFLRLSRQLCRFLHAANAHRGRRVSETATARKHWLRAVVPPARAQASRSCRPSLPLCGLAENRLAAVEDSAAPSATSPRGEILHDKGEPVDVALVK
ncbi:hypothetical protein B0H14DRAFT_2964071 [Mycena olivaceomarginata]|nr:hypothetical protein B0H14DRAFT_2964071 [Mycena olivaceomarginata]